MSTMLSAPLPLYKFLHVVDDERGEIQQYARRSYLLDGLERFIFRSLELGFRWGCLGTSKHLDDFLLRSGGNVAGRRGLSVAPDWQARQELGHVSLEFTQTCLSSIL